MRLAASAPGGAQVRRRLDVVARQLEERGHHLQGGLVVLHQQEPERRRVGSSDAGPGRDLLAAGAAPPSPARP